jgi:hypothetical protein
MQVTLWMAAASCTVEVLTAAGRYVAALAAAPGAKATRRACPVVVVELELLEVMPLPRIMPLSWDFSAHWFALFSAADRRLPEQGRNRRIAGIRSRPSL